MTPDTKTLTTDLARLDAEIPKLEQAVEQLRTSKLALINASATAGLAVKRAAEARADREEMATLRAEELAAGDELTAVVAEEDAAIDALTRAKGRRHEVAILAAEHTLDRARATLHALKDQREPLVMRAATELEGLLTAISDAQTATHNAWYALHEAKNTPVAQRGQSPYLGVPAPSALGDAIEALVAFARGTNPRQKAESETRRYVENLQSAYAPRDPRTDRAPNDPPANQPENSVPFAATGDGHFVERSRAAAGKLSATA